MNSPIESHRYLAGFADIEKIANDVLFRKYIIEKRRGADKVDYIEDTDQEGVIANLNGGRPIPGLIYTFVYLPSKYELQSINDGSKARNYVDHVPIIFCLGVKARNVLGINLTVLPQEERLAFLQSYYDIYSGFFKNIEDLSENNIPAINSKFVKSVMTRDGQKAIDELKRVTGIKLSYTYRNYSMDRISDLRMIEYSEWQLIPYFKPDNAVKMMNIEKLHDLYRRAKDI